MRIDKKKVSILFPLTFLITCLGFVQVGLVQGIEVGTAYIIPEEIHTNVCKDFTVTVVLTDVDIIIMGWRFMIPINTTQMSVVNVTIIPPSTGSWRFELGELRVNGSGLWIVPGSYMSLANITFHCEGPGISKLLFEDFYGLHRVILIDEVGNFEYSPQDLPPDVYQYEEPVGGIWISVDKFNLLAPYIALVSTIILAVSISVAYIKIRKKQ